MRFPSKTWSQFKAWLCDEQHVAMMRCAAAAAGIVAIGSLGFHLIETEWSYWDSLYFTLVTISTVGYGDYEISENGRKFAALMILCGIGIFTYSLSTLVHIASDLNAAARRKMKQNIAHSDNHIIVCGYGRMGQMICGELDRSDLPCVIIERDEAGCRQAIEDGRLVVEGVASEDATLLAAGIERAQGVVCAVNCDAENMFITVTVREINPTCRIISRAESPTAARKLEHAGASLVISPHQMAGKTIATALVHPRLSRFMNRGDEESCYFELGEVEIVAGSRAVGKTIRELGGELPGLVFVAIERPEAEIIVQPHGEEQFHEGDLLIFAGAGDVMHCMRKEARLARHAEPVLV